MAVPGRGARPRNWGISESTVPREKAGQELRRTGGRDTVLPGEGRELAGVPSASQLRSPARLPRPAAWLPAAALAPQGTAPRGHWLPHCFPGAGFSWV